MTSSNTFNCIDHHLSSIRELFSFSPFGLRCLQSNNCATVELDERCICRHLKKHGLDSRVSTVRSLLEEYKKELLNAKALGSIDPYRSDSKTYAGFSCVCGQSFVKIGNANRHCKTVGCDSSKLQKVDLIKLCCGRYVTHAKVTSFFNETPHNSKQQFDYCEARAVLFPILPKREKQDHTYTHMFTPLIHGCGGGKQFVQKIKSDFSSIHSSPCSSTEFLLVQIHKHAEDWLLKFVQKNILMVPGNLRAGLQTFEGGEIEEISHRCTYTMQHDPRSLLPELKKLLSFSYRRGLFASRGFDTSNAFAVPYFLKDLLLEVPQSVASLPFVAEFCLMFAFRVSTNGSEINMISCDTVSSVFSKISSVLKAAVCSVICSFSNQSFTIFGTTHAVTAQGWVVIRLVSRRLSSSNCVVVNLFQRCKLTSSSTLYLESRSNLITARQERLCFLSFHAGKSTTIRTHTCTPPKGAGFKLDKYSSDINIFT
jgi:hypothetical protein